MKCVYNIIKTAYMELSGNSDANKELVQALPMKIICSEGLLCIVVSLA